MVLSGLLRYFLDSLRTGSKRNPAEQTPPTVSWLIKHRLERADQRALTQGATPNASLYRMYEYLVVGFNAGLRTEIEYFFNKPDWAVKDIPNPEDPDPARTAFLAVLTEYLALAFNRLIERGLPRGSPAIITGPAAEEELRKRPVLLERQPPWASNVKPLEQKLVILDASGHEPAEEDRSLRFLKLNIIVEEPHVLFV